MAIGIILSILSILCGTIIILGSLLNYDGRSSVFITVICLAVIASNVTMLVSIFRDKKEAVAGWLPWSVAWLGLMMYYIWPALFKLINEYRHWEGIIIGGSGVALIVVGHILACREMCGRKSA